MASTGQFQICCNGTIGVEIHHPGLTGLFRRSIEAECLHFSSASMQIQTGADFKVGDNLVLDLQVLDLRVEELVGRVTSASASEQRRFYNIDFNSGRQRRDTKHCLRQLETLYQQQAE